MKKEFHCVLGFDCNNEALMATMQAIVVENLRKMYAAALLAHQAANDGSMKPEIHLYSDDFLMGKEDINVPPSGGAASEPVAQVKDEVAAAGGPKSMGSASYGDEEES